MNGIADSPRLRLVAGSVGGGAGASAGIAWEAIARLVLDATRSTLKLITPQA